MSQVPQKSDSFKDREDKIIDDAINQDYKYGFVSDIEQDIIPPGLNEDVIRLISSKKNEPKWLLEWRLKSYRNWKKMVEPTWGKSRISPNRLPGHKLLCCTKRKEKIRQFR